MIRKTTKKKKKKKKIFAIFARMRILVTDPFRVFSFILSTDFNGGYCNFMVSYVWSIVFFFAI